jgi:hypothetical protein
MHRQLCQDDPLYLMHLSRFMDLLPQIAPLLHRRPATELENETAVISPTSYFRSPACFCTLLNVGRLWRRRIPPKARTTKLRCGSVNFAKNCEWPI